MIIGLIKVITQIERIESLQPMDLCSLITDLARGNIWIKKSDLNEVYWHIYLTPNVLNVVVLELHGALCSVYVFKHDLSL